MKKNQDVAIIGVASRFPGADNIHDFYENLRLGVDSVIDMPDERRKFSGLDLRKDYVEFGYLNRIDQFDHKFFHIPLSEAEVIDPQQRFALEVASGTIENAGYSLESFRGTNTAVIIAAYKNDYVRYMNLTNKITGTAFIGGQLASVAAKVNYYLDLHGPAYIIETTCSSSLITIHEGCRKIVSGESDYVIAGGVCLPIDLPEKEYYKRSPLGIISPDAKSRAFDAGANGISVGEGAAFILLKELDRAKEDGDHIWAVIKGSAVNHDGNRGNGFGAPSADAHAQVIVKIWEDAGINPETVSYIEAHGTGTKLGDPIEIEAFTQAFNRYTDKKKFCPIGSVKTNIGHLGPAAGVAGMIKVLLSLKYKKLFPSIHYNSPNPHIDFENSAVFVNTEFRDWESSSTPRRAGISSLGITGTNVHVLVEEYDPPSQGESKETDQIHLMTVSAKAPEVIYKYIEEIGNYIENQDVELSSLTYVFNKGRGDYEYREAFVFSTEKKLLESLEKALKYEDKYDRNTKSETYVYLCSDSLEKLEESIDFFCLHFSIFEEEWEKWQNQAKGKVCKKFLFQVCLYKLLSHLGIKFDHAVGTGFGNISVSVVTNKLSMEQGIMKAESNEVCPEFNEGGFKNFITGICRKESNVVFLESGFCGKLSSISELHSEHRVFFAYTEKQNYSFHSFLACSYVNGTDIDWEDYYKGKKIKRIEAPTYPFKKTRCWPDGEIRSDDIPDELKRSKTIIEPTLLFPDPTETEKTLSRIWSEVLRVHEIRREDNFFDLGGDSLMGTQIQQLVKEYFNMDVSFDDLYNYTSFEEFAERIDEIRKEKEAVQDEHSLEKDIHIEKTDKVEGPLSYNQESLYYLYKLHPASPFYNMSWAIELEGKLDKEALEKTLSAIVHKHSILRTVYFSIDGEDRQKIVADYNFIITVVDLIQSNTADLDTKINNVIIEESLKPFDLEREIPIRAKLVKISGERNILIVVLHHIAADTWSASEFMKDFMAMYSALYRGLNYTLSPTPIQYIDFAFWQHKYLKGGDYATQISFWKDVLNDAPPTHALKTDYERPEIIQYKGARHFFEIPETILQKLEAISQQEKITLFNILLTSLSVLVFRLSGDDDIIIGTPIAGRSIRETERLIGYFVNMIPVRIDLSGNPGFTELLRKVNICTMEAFSHQNIPFEKIVEEVNPKRSSSYSPIFQLALVLQNIQFEELKLPDLDVKFLTPNMGSNTSRYDFTISIIKDAHILSGMIEYSTELFLPATIKRMMNEFCTIIEYIASNPGEKISEIPMVSEEERKILLQKTPQEENFDF